MTTAMVVPDTRALDNIFETFPIETDAWKYPDEALPPKYETGVDIGPPEVKKKESINRIIANNGTWKVLEDGYVLCTIGLAEILSAHYTYLGQHSYSFSPSLPVDYYSWIPAYESGSLVGLAILVNDERVEGIKNKVFQQYYTQRFRVYNHGGGWTSPIYDWYDEFYFYQGSSITTLIKVKKDDVVKLSVVGSPWQTVRPASVSCYYVPPKTNFIRADLRHSLFEEQPTGEKWVDNRPIYKKTFTWSGNLWPGSAIPPITVLPVPIASVSYLISGATQIVGKTKAKTASGRTATLEAQIDGNYVVALDPAVVSEYETWTITLRYVK